MKTPEPAPKTHGSRPRTRAGWQVRSLLIGAPEPQTGGRLKRISTSLAWLSVSRDYRRVGGETLTVLIRRRFATRPDTEIVQYAEDVTRHAGRRAVGLARAVEATINVGTGRMSALSGIGGYTLARAQFVLLRDLTREMTADEVDDIIAFAEVRQERQAAGPAATQPRRSRQGGTLPDRPQPRAAQRSPAAMGTGVNRAGPTTLAGQQLKAAFTDGRNTPDDPRDDDAAAVLDCLFELAIPRRFRSDYEVREVTQFVQMIAERFPRDLPVPFTVAEAMVRSQLGEPIPIGDTDRPSAMEMKALASRAATVDLGLLDRELDELLVEAEHRARGRGFQPTPAPQPQEQTE